MIGQKKALANIDNMKELPHFMLILGDKGSGKKTLVKEIIHKTGWYSYYCPDNKVETIRTAIHCMYKVSAPTIFIMTDVDDMSVASKNVLLKVMEEYPRNVYIIMTVCNRQNVLNTVLSRAYIQTMDTYSKDEILEYALSKQTDFDSNIVWELCRTPGDVDLLFSMGADEFYKYVEKVIDNIAYVSISNVFKLTSKIALKPDAEGYDLKMFLTAIQRVCNKHIQEIEDKEERNYWIEAVKVTSNTLSMLNSVTGINKSMLLDVWILNIRKVWS